MHFKKQVPTDMPAAELNTNSGQINNDIDKETQEIRPFVRKKHKFVWIGITTTLVMSFVVIGIFLFTTNKSADVGYKKRERRNALEFVDGRGKNIVYEVGGKVLGKCHETHYGIRYTVFEIELMDLPVSIKKDTKLEDKRVVKPYKETISECPWHDPDNDGIVFAYYVGKEHELEMGDISVFDLRDFDFPLFGHECFGGIGYYDGNLDNKSEYRTYERYCVGNKKASDKFLSRWVYTTGDYKDLYDVFGHVTPIYDVDTEYADYLIELRKEHPEWENDITMVLEGKYGL